MFTVSGRDPRTGKGLQVCLEQNRITEVKPTDYRGSHWISSGLIDLQVNGFYGFDLNDGQVTPERVLSLGRKLLALGTTTFLPTVITASEPDMTAAIQTIRDARDREPLLRSMIPGIHVEGPHIAAEDGPRGAHPVEHVRPPDLNEFIRLQEACSDMITMVTLSPHWAQSADYIRELRNRNVTVAIGHTNATHAQIIAAVDAGAALSTHLGNGAAATLPRHPNLIWTQLGEERLHSTLIADGHHLPAETFKVMLRAKGLNSSILVSDVAAPGGLAPGVYSQSIGGKVVLEENGRLGIEGTPYLAGAARPLCDCVATAISMGDITLADALMLATVNAGRFVGHGDGVGQGNVAGTHHRGRLAVGEVADVITFDWQRGDSTLSIQSVFKAGKRKLQVC